MGKSQRFAGNSEIVDRDDVLYVSTFRDRNDDIMKRIRDEGTLLGLSDLPVRDGMLPAWMLVPKFLGEKLNECFVFKSHSLHPPIASACSRHEMSGLEKEVNGKYAWLCRARMTGVFGEKVRDNRVLDRFLMMCLRNVYRILIDKWSTESRLELSLKETARSYGLICEAFRIDYQDVPAYFDNPENIWNYSGAEGQAGTRMLEEKITITIRDEVLDLVRDLSRDERGKLMEDFLAMQNIDYREVIFGKNGLSPSRENFIKILKDPDKKYGNEDVPYVARAIMHYAECYGVKLGYKPQGAWKPQAVNVTSRRRDSGYQFRVRSADGKAKELCQPKRLPPLEPL